MFKKFFGNLAKMPELALRYQVKVQPEGELLTKQTLMIGQVRYRSCVDVSVNPGGFFFTVKAPFSKYESILIPWTDVTGVADSRLYNMPAKTLTIGNITTITVKPDIWERIRGYLK